MKRAFAAAATIGLLVALALPAGAKTIVKTHTDYALAGEARALELAIGGQGVTLGMALSRADSTPSAIGVGAGQCTLLGDDPDPDSLPCTEESTVTTRWPGSPGDGIEVCAGSLPAPLNDIVDLKIACGSSKSGLRNGLPFTTNTGKLAHLGVTLPVGAVLDNLPAAALVDDLTQTLSPVLDLAPKEVRDAVENVVDIIDDAAATEALAVELAPSISKVARKGSGLQVTSDAAGALIGVLGIPDAKIDGTDVSASSDPLKNGLLIIEVGRAQASATIDTKTAVASGAASPALVTVKVRDITKPEPTYVEVSVAPGETVTVLAGTPAESTITAADSTVEEDGNSAKAVADAVRLHLLKGVNGGVVLGLGRATAAVNADVVKDKRVIAAPPEKVLPFTGGTNMTWFALALIALSELVLMVRRRFTR
ncbi:MAG: hypothetical protein ACRDI3_07255 [Actinomycetota bacterium]